MSRLQGVHQGNCKFILQSSGGKESSFQEGKRNSTEGRRETENLGGFQDEKSH
jgi:hypothetical protein